MSDDPTKPGMTWHTWAIATAMTLTGGISNFVATHWGGVTTEQLAQAEQRITKKIEPIAQSVATLTADGDNMRKMVVESVAASEKRLHDELAAKKRKRGE